MTFPCKAATVWSDDFNDGNYSGWTVESGMFSAEEKNLNPLLDGDSNIIYHSSLVAKGTWSFDAYFTAFGGGAAEFMLTMDNYGYELEMPYANMIQLYRMAGPDQVRVVYYTFQKSLSGWQHFDITRDSKGRLCIYHNGTLVIDIVDIVDTSYSESQFFVYIALNSGQAIDNIVVSNTVDIEPPPQIPFYMQTWFLTILAIVGVVMVVAVFTVFLGRRKT